MRDMLVLEPLARYSDHALLGLRCFVGAFLIWGVLDNVLDAARMDEFAEFLAKFQFPMPDLMARLSVWAQLLVGASFVAGLLTRWAAIVCVVNFVVAVVMVDRFSGIRGAFPPGVLVMLGFYLAARGAGRFSVDAWLLRRAAS
jgi:putative oxidoreductase